MVRLRHPEKSIDDLFENMENEHDKSEETTGNISLHMYKTLNV